MIDLNVDTIIVLDGLSDKNDIDVNQINKDGVVYSVIKVWLKIDYNVEVVFISIVIKGLMMVHFIRFENIDLINNVMRNKRNNNFYFF